MSPKCVKSESDEETRVKKVVVNGENMYNGCEIGAIIKNNIKKNKSGEEVKRSRCLTSYKIAAPNF